MQEVIINMKKVNIISLILFIISFIAAAAMQVLMNVDFHIRFSWIAIVYMFVIIPAHEGLHAIGFIFLSKAPRENVEFGIHKEYFTPYCHCSKYENTKSGYIKSLLLPNIVLIIITGTIIAYTNKIFWALIFGYVVSSGTGDYYMTYLVLKYQNSTKFVDHPTEPGFYVLYK